ncbi:hypothetical protein JTE90_008203, partial [Oedothorax gibbosus]
SVLKVLTLVFATTTKIFTGGGSRRAPPPGTFPKHATAPSHSLRGKPPRGKLCRAARYGAQSWSAFPFSGVVFLWSVVCYTPLSEFRFPGPLVRLSRATNPFLWGLMSVSHRTPLNPGPLVLSHSASSAYQKWPPALSSCLVRLQSCKGDFSPIFKI